MGIAARDPRTVSGRGIELSIGGIRLRIDCPDARFRVPDPQYRPFVRQAADAGEPAQLDIRLHAGGFPFLDRLVKRFDTKESWAMFQDGARRAITFHPSGRVEPLWTASFDRTVRRVSVHCRVAAPTGRGRRGVIDLPVAYPLDQLLLMYHFALRRGMLVHAAGMVSEGKAFLFPGASGAGKSTFSRLLSEAKAGRVLSDERMIIRRVGGRFRAYGTPWAGTAGIARSGDAPLAGAFFLRHGRENRLRRLAAAEAADRLLPTVSIPWYDPDAAAPVISLAKRLAAAVPCHEFEFVPDRSAVAFLKKHLKAGS